MKTTKIIIAAVLVIMTLAMNAQDKRALYATIIYSNDMNRLETWISHTTDKTNYMDIEEAEMPVISQTFYSDYADINYKNEASFEQWMATPFEEAIVEIGPLMEPWMSYPFETEEIEDELSLESWMSSPFETDENIQIEDWMTSSNW